MPLLCATWGQLHWASGHRLSPGTVTSWHMGGRHIWESAHFRGDLQVGLPGHPGDGDTMSGIDGEGQQPREVASLLHHLVLAAPVCNCLEVCVEGAAVKLHQVQDGSGEALYDLLCEREGRWKRYEASTGLPEMRYAQWVECLPCMQPIHFAPHLLSLALPGVIFCVCMRNFYLYFFFQE